MMDKESTQASPEPDPRPTPQPEPRVDPPPAPSAQEVTPGEHERIRELRAIGWGTRRIASALGRNRKTIQRVVDEQASGATRTSPPPPPASKLDPYRELISELAQKGLTASRILREIQARGYAGGRTILAEHLRRTRAPLAPKRPGWRRFETQMGEELQIDWSVYRVPVGGEAIALHALSAVLGHSRWAHVRFYPDERQSTLLEGLAVAFEAIGGVTCRLVLDNMASAVLGRVGRDRKPIWHPRFADFAAYYGFEPFACWPGDPDRKGKGERFYDYLERDFVRGAEFASFDDANARVAQWLDETANVRRHGTTGLVPAEVWRAERDFLIALPERRFGVHDEEPRQVGPDATVSVRGRLYTVPAYLAHQTVTVRLFAAHFVVVDRDGRVALERPYADRGDPRRLIIESAHYDALPRTGPAGGKGAARRLEEALLARCPGIAELIEGIKVRMKAIAHVHLRQLWALADRYGDVAFARAVAHATSYRRFEAGAVARILERHEPEPREDLPPPAGAAARVVALLGDVDEESLEGYGRFDTDTADAGEDVVDDEEREEGGDAA